MKEIGAERRVFRLNPNAKNEYPVAAEMGWFRDGQQVLCIPAPSGLRK